MYIRIIAFSKVNGIPLAFSRYSYEHIQYLYVSHFCYHYLFHHHFNENFISNLQSTVHVDYLPVLLIWHFGKSHQDITKLIVHHYRAIDTFSPYSTEVHQ